MLNTTMFFPLRPLWRTAVPAALTLLAACFFAWSGMASAASDPASVPPPPEGKTFRIAYLEAGPYWSYSSLLKKIQEALARHGWDKAVLFPPELHFSLGWDEALKHTYASRVLNIFHNHQFDLLLSFGTEASQTVVAVNPGTVPIVALSITNPISAGIVPGPTDSGAPNLTTALNITNSGAIMFSVFHRILQFESLGLMYSDTESGRLYAYLDDAREVGREAGFAVLEYNELGVDETVDECLRGVRELAARGAEAIFISNLKCVDLQFSDPTPIYDFLEERKILTMAAEDRQQVMHFAVIGMLPFDEGEIAEFHARQIISILSGAEPGSLSMTVPFNFRLLVNLASAQRYGIDFPITMLMFTDEIFLRQHRLQTNSPNP